MLRIASVAEARAADAAAAAAVGEAVLIGRASAALAAEARTLMAGCYGRRVLVVAGSGHNGADALRAGAQLARRGAAVDGVRSSDRSGDEHVRSAWADLLAAGGRERSWPDGRYDLVLDGLVGVGNRGGGLTGRATGLADALDGPVLAVDLPSGVDADTGSVPGAAVRADATVTFGSLKPGLVVGAGAAHAGTVTVAEIGLGLSAPGPTCALEDADVAALLPVPAASDDKYSRGVVGLLAGSAAYPGAGMLCAGGAVRAGAGYVRMLGEPGLLEQVRGRFPSVVGTVLQPGDGPDAVGRVDAWTVGSGAGTDDGALSRVRHLLAGDLPLLLDADALAVGADALRGRRAPTLITPHAGEFRRLTGREPAGDPLGETRRAAAELGVTVLLKGLHTVVAAPDGRALVNPTGCTWLATAGTGDVLAGAAGALLAQFAKRSVPPADLALLAGATAAYLHGVAARVASAGGVPLAADRLPESWADAVRAVRVS